MSKSYVATLDLLEDGEQAQAYEEFRLRFVPTVKRLYSEAAQVHPVRFTGIDDWCAWSRKLYILAQKAQDAMEAGDFEEAELLLGDIRYHFYALHDQTNTRKANDTIFAFQRHLEGDALDAARLNALREEMATAAVPAAAGSRKDDFEAMRAKWTKKADGALSDDGIRRFRRRGLRKATERFYNDFGLLLE